MCITQSFYDLSILAAYLSACPLDFFKSGYNSCFEKNWYSLENVEKKRQEKQEGHDCPESLI
jgi:hypothetical protein